jgi:hypothetical protein
VIATETMEVQIVDIVNARMVELVMEINVSVLLAFLEIFVKFQNAIEKHPIITT